MTRVGFYWTSIGTNETITTNDGPNGASGDTNRIFSYAQWSMVPNSMLSNYMTYPVLHKWAMIGATAMTINGVSIRSHAIKYAVSGSQQAGQFEQVSPPQYMVMEDKYGYLQQAAKDTFNNTYSYTPNKNFHDVLTRRDGKVHNCIKYQHWSWGSVMSHTHSGDTLPELLEFAPAQIKSPAYDFHWTWSPKRKNTVSLRAPGRGDPETQLNQMMLHPGHAPDVKTLYLSYSSNLALRRMENLQEYVPVVLLHAPKYVSPTGIGFDIDTTFTALFEYSIDLTFHCTPNVVLATSQWTMAPIPVANDNLGTGQDVVNKERDYAYHHVVPGVGTHPDSFRCEANVQLRR